MGAGNLKEGHRSVNCRGWGPVCLRNCWRAPQQAKVILKGRTLVHCYIALLAHSLEPQALVKRCISSLPWKLRDILLLGMHALSKYKMKSINEQTILWIREYSETERPIGQWLKNHSQPQLSCQTMIVMSLEQTEHLEVLRLPFLVANCLLVTANSMGGITANEWRNECRIPVASFRPLVPAMSEHKSVGGPH